MLILLSADMTGQVCFRAESALAIGDVIRQQQDAKGMRQSGSDAGSFFKYFREAFAEDFDFCGFIPNIAQVFCQVFFSLCSLMAPGMGTI